MLPLTGATTFGLFWGLYLALATRGLLAHRLRAVSVHTLSTTLVASTIVTLAGPKPAVAFLATFPLAFLAYLMWIEDLRRRAATRS